MHGQRASAIVRGMLDHSRSSTTQKVETNLNALIDEYLKLAYHGLRAKDNAFTAKLITSLDRAIPKARVVPQDMGRVLLNLFNNAFYAVQQKQRSTDPALGYQPQVRVSTDVEGNNLTIKVRDNGAGIPPAIVGKIFSALFSRPSQPVKVPAWAYHWVMILWQKDTVARFW